MTEQEQRQAATDFSNYWRNKGDEKSDSQRFWIDFIQDVLGIENVTQKIQFEKRVNVDGQTKFIDVYIPETRTLIEQKSVDKDLSKQYSQSGGWMATPYQQGRRYSQFLPVDEAARWIIACNFKSFEIHDMNKPNDPPIVVLLDEIRHKLPVFDFMFNKKKKELSHEMEVSVKAGEIVGVLYDKLIKQYKDPEAEETLKSLNALCVRLVFCLYAEDAGIFGSNHDMFHDYFKDIPATQFRKSLAEFFKILDTKTEDRDKYLAEDNPRLAEFPYVNGGLFADENIEIPPFTDELKSLLLERASADFDWSEISPTIFGAVFESTLNPETRRSGGMHYTSIENIHKVIDPLFLDELTKELDDICNIQVEKTRKTKLLAFQNKLAGLKFLDPACGSGNFLTETYIYLRRLENRMLDTFNKGQMVLGEVEPIKISIGQFYGIEINDFAVTVAKTALWIAESQMLKETEGIVHMNLDFLPLKSYANIIEANALKIDWNDVIPANELNYIMGNPPFVGQRYISPKQHDELVEVLSGWDNSGKMDYVTGWYRKSADYITATTIKCALVSTNSITQGEQVAYLWEPLFDLGISIDFAYRTFRWDSEASLKAKVHCVIIGFSNTNARNHCKRIYKSNGEVIEAKNINGYLIDADNTCVKRRNKPLCEIPEMYTGNRQADGGYLTLSAEDVSELLGKEPGAAKYIRKMVGAVEFINNKELYCLWLKDITPNELRQHRYVMERVKKCQEHRLEGKPDRKRLASTPHLFREQINPDTAIVVPTVSSERRRYVPMGFIDNSIIVNANAQIIADAQMYHLGILTSNVHMAWMRAVAGRLKSDYRYSKDVVYNNFPWPNVTEEQKHSIEDTANGILNARKLYPDCSLADLYDELSMPVELRKAHQENDRAVMKAYGFPIKGFTEEDCVSELMKMYQKLTK